MHAISIFLLVVGGLLVTAFSSHATQDMADMTAGSSSMLGVRWSLKPMWNTCGTGINLSRLSHINVMDLKNLKRQATSRAALKLMQITRCSPDFFLLILCFIFYLWFMTCTVMHGIPCNLLLIIHSFNSFTYPKTLYVSLHLLRFLTTVVQLAQEYSLLKLKGFVYRPAFLVCAACMASFTAILLIRAWWRGFLELFLESHTPSAFKASWSSWYVLGDNCNNVLLIAKVDLVHCVIY